jgi:hypothetical protein
MKRALNVLKIVVASLVLLYFGDYLSVRFRIPNREPLTDVQIEVFYAVGLKGQKTEFVRGDPETETCVHSMFPQDGYRPCWYVMRHMTKWIDASLRSTESAGTNCGDSHCNPRLVHWGLPWRLPQFRNSRFSPIAGAGLWPGDRPRKTMVCPTELPPRPVSGTSPDLPFPGPC